MTLSPPESTQNVATTAVSCGPDTVSGMKTRLFRNSIRTAAGVAGGDALWMASALGAAVVPRTAHTKNALSTQAPIRESATSISTMNTA